MAPNFKLARNLEKNDLGGYIFGCTNDTMGECLAKQLFGLPSRHYVYVKMIEPGLPLFLFNYSERKIHGIYEAASAGKLSYDSYAWTADGSDRTKYPAQVQIRVRLQCQALAESQFKPIIADNYYSDHHFSFELDHAQASRLISKLSSVAIGPRPLIPKNLPKITPVKKTFSSDHEWQESGASQALSSTGDFANYCDSAGTSGFLDDSTSSGRNSQAVVASLSNRVVDEGQKNFIYMKLKELALSDQYEHENMAGHVGEDASHDGTDLVVNTHDNKLMVLGDSNVDSSISPADFPSVIAQCCREIQELKAINQDHTRKIESLEKKMAELVNRCETLESLSNPSTKLADEESLDEFHLNNDESIFIMGGYDGVSWSSALHSFSPSRDTLRSLTPMSYVRLYASVARLNGELYVFGGGTGSIWYDAVESYNVVNNEWTLCPPLNTRRGNLAGAGLKGKVFAVGGGNGIDCYSDLEMLDPDVGCWIRGRSMIQKRFALAATELNGALYAVGGYDGNDYLESAERFDPREHSWSRIGSLKSKRGCHSLVVMNEKLYAVGGFNGTTMVPSMEIYDPRMEMWMAGEPLNQARGYLVAAALGQSIYAIGGVNGEGDTLDTVECYKDGEGWQLTNSRALGKRSFACAIVFGED